MAVIGAPVPRIDGPAKVTGGAVYTADVRPGSVAHAVVICSPIPKGRVTAIDDAAAAAVPGVLTIVTSRNCPRLTLPDPIPPSAGQHRLPLQDDRLDHLGQPVAVVVAETREAADEAAALVRVSYADQAATVVPADQLPMTEVLAEPFHFSWTSATVSAGEPTVKVEAVYTTPFEHHNPIELPTTVATWTGDTLVVHDATQWLRGVQRMLAACFGMPIDKVRVISKFVGGSFGSKRLTWPHVLLAAIAAKVVGRPVALSLSRRQMFTLVGHRPRTEQRVVLTAGGDGALVSMEHGAITTTSVHDNFTEPATSKTRMIYACPTGKFSRKLVKLDLPTPTTMRAPGEATGFFALESAMDELAAMLHMDPLTLRLKNYADVDPVSGRPWSSKALRRCYEVAGDRFGWSRRQPAPGSMHDAAGRLLGWGMASAAYPANRSPASARVVIGADGRVVVQSGTHEMGAGTYTALAQIAADTLGLEVGVMTVELGDTALPRTTVSGGSRTLASVGSAVLAASQSLRRKLVAAAIADPASPLHGVAADEVAVEGGRLFLRARPEVGATVASVVASTPARTLEATADSAPPAGDGPPMLSFGAHFVEVMVDPDLPIPRVTRVVSAFGVGHVVNSMIAKSQLAGGIIGGIGMALLEETIADPVAGGFLNTSLSSYLVPVAADVPPIEILLVDEDDRAGNPLGTKGVGELGIVGAAAAVANAVYHATGVRKRDLPIRVDDLLVPR